ncbi:hypothetical protein Ct61P_09333 [Colletotrichum tofieldiae]|nr:hypothetical protein Ct61P_09333 [Colletotrichum tofieldiae]
MRIKYQQYILEKAAMGVLANKQVFLYTSHWDGKSSCDGAVAANVIPSQACYPDQGQRGGRDLFDVFINVYEKIQDHTWYQGLLHSANSTGQY